MSHSHGHGTPESGPPRPELARVLFGVVAAIAVVTAVAMVVLWPSSDDVPHATGPYSGEGVTTVDATVTSVTPWDCGADGGFGIDDQPTAAGDCRTVTATVDEGGEKASFELDPTRHRAVELEEGDDIRLMRFQPTDADEPSFEFRDFQRGFPLLALALAFAVLVAVVGRLRGALAIVGIGVTVFALMKFVLPAILAGESPLLVAIVGSTGIMIAVLYLAHGVSIRTTSALFGTLFGIAFTALLGVVGTHWAQLTGVSSEDDLYLIGTVPDLRFQGIVAASMVIAGLGVLNDVTVTQASAVWEMRALQPIVGRWELFRSAMRIGRDHIASSVYTLVFAYAGSAMTVMLLITAYQQGLLEVLTAEQIANEVVRTLVGAIGLVLAVPVTTAFAVWLAPPAVEGPLSDDSQKVVPKA
ncbi:MAG: YibE/F family protein [Aeromicrobium sp.]|uniref:YibE/F family protein n=1 Tax=Aeromicrobium sp. TaxID=1871063 RepID=UPI0039E25C82